MKKILKAFSFEGTASRTEWWIVHIILVPLLVITLEIDTKTGGESGGWFFPITLLVSAWPLLATQIRRWADRGKHPLWILIGFVPFIGNLWAFVELGLFPTKEEEKDPFTR